MTRPSDVFFRERAYSIAVPATTTVPGGAAPVGSIAPSPPVTPPNVSAPGAGGAERLEQSESPTELTHVPGATYALIELDEVRTNPRQPRAVFDEDELAELAHSIKEIGVLQPIVVRRLDEREQSSHTSGPGEVGAEAAAAQDSEAAVPTQQRARFELVMGERRWRAARVAGETAIPAIIRDTPDDAMLRDALLENLHRSQLNPLEEAAAYQQLLEDFGCTHEELAARIGRSRPQITNIIRLLGLPPLVARRVAAGVLSSGHARALLSLPDGAAMERLAQRIVAEGLSVRSVEEIVAMGVDNAPARRRGPSATEPRPELDEAAARLADRLDTRVSISMGRRKGKVTVEFASVEDLDRILGALGETGTADREQRLAG